MISRTLRRARGLASLAVGAVIASVSIAGLALPAAAAEQEPAAPSITVSPQTDVDPSVENTFTVTGEGFVGDGARFGAYVLIGDQDIWEGEGPLIADGWLKQAWVQPRQIVDGEFSIEITIPADSFKEGVKYTAATSAAHGLSVTDRSLDAFAPIKLKAPAPEPEPTQEPTAEPTAEPTEEPTTEPTAEPTEEPTEEPTAAPAPEVTVSKTSGLDRDGETITVKGTGFVPNESTTGVRPPLAGKFTGAYVIVGQFADEWKPSEGAASDNRKPIFVQKWGVHAQDMTTIGGEKTGAIAIAEDGSFEVTLNVDLNAEAFADFDPQNAANFGVYTYAGGGAKYAPFETFTNLTFADAQPGEGNGETPGEGNGNEKPEDKPGTPEDPQCKSTVISDATLNWGVRESFREYITGSVAKGTISTKGKNVTKTAAGFGWSAGKGEFDAAAGKGQVSYSGAVQFTGHAGLLDMKFSNPQIIIKNSKTAAIKATAHATSLDGASFDGTVEIAALDLASAKHTAKNGVITFTNAPATLTSAGEKAFGGFYEAGETLDPVTFALLQDCSDGALPGPGKPGTAKPVIKFGGGFSGNKITAGSTAKFRLTGMTPGAKARASIHSEPISLGTKTLSARGEATFTWNVPADFPAGTHTFRAVVNGTSYSQQFEVLAAAAPSDQGPTSPGTGAEQCTANKIAGATLSWGVKQDFRSYITGNIAKGSISTSGAANNGGQFTWSGGTGTVNTDQLRGSARFGGSVHFTGHGGILDLTIASPRILLTGPSTATLVVDVNGTNMEGDKLNFPGVRFATLNLAAGAKATTGSAISYSGVPATLTPAGAQAFAGFYKAGEALDGVSFTLPIGAETDCSAETGTLPSTGADAAPLAMSLMLLTVGFAAVVISRKRGALNRG